MTEEGPKLTGSLLLDPWRIRRWLELRGELEPPPAQPPTRSEQTLWEVLQNEPPGWSREYATGPYRLDFYCPSMRVAVEVDGSSHWGNQGRRRDALRDEWHRIQGITTKRFSAAEVETQLPFVLESILGFVQADLTAASPTEPQVDGVTTADTTDRAPAAAVPTPDLPLPSWAHDAIAAEAEVLVESAGELLAADMGEAVAQVLAVAEACRTILPSHRPGRSLLDLLDF